MTMVNSGLKGLKNIMQAKAACLAMFGDSSQSKGFPMTLLRFAEYAQSTS